MLAVIVILAVSLVFVSISQRRIGAILRVERAVLEKAEYTEGPVEAMAAALSLLETGFPPSNPYECAATVKNAGGDRTYAVSFKSRRSERWTISVTPVDDPGGLPPMPTTFAN
jgi:hypothetical protein